MTIFHEAVSNPVVQSYVKQTHYDDKLALSLQTWGLCQCLAVRVSELSILLEELFSFLSSSITPEKENKSSTFLEFVS